MLLSAFASPRRLVILCIFVFFAILVLVRNSQYSGYLPKYDLPSYKTDGRPNQDTQVVSSEKPAMWDEYKPEQDLPAAGPPSDEEEFVYDRPTQAIKPTVVLDIPISSQSASANASENASATVVHRIQHTPYAEVQKKIQDFIQWTPPDTQGHWPPWNGYKDKDYDPNRWEGLDWETDFYTENGVKQFERQGLTAKPYLPYPGYNTEEWKKHWSGEYVPCKGPRGKLLNESLDDTMMAYPSLPRNFPNVTIGSAEAIGIDETHCFDRFSRYSPYGAYSPEDSSHPLDRPHWDSIWWGQLQDECLQRNNERYDPSQRAPMITTPSRTLPKASGLLEKIDPAAALGKDAAKYHSRTAVLIRTWEGYTYTENDLQAIRALITELSLMSGGEYQVYLFVNVKQREADIYGNPQVYQDILREVVPRELRDISVLWTEAVCEEWYPKVGEWQVYWMQFMPLQWFAQTHPQFDYIWNWETDARYTGNHYHFLEQIAAFAKSVPRKHLWERNSRFYFPAAHGNYASFLADTDAAIENATAEGIMTPVWGAQPYSPTQIPIGPKPPTGEEYDEYTWGVGEEADLITLQPIWDPTETQWSFRHKIWNFIPGVSPVFTAENPIAEGFYHEGFEGIPRRTFINTVARFSKKLLRAMHNENLAGRSMQAEMWPATVALQHGLKAVYAPHPIWTDRKWPAWYLDAIFNADGGVTAKWGQQSDSPYDHDREANFRGWSWYYQSEFPKALYRRWLGWKAKDGGLGNVGGRDFEETGNRTADGSSIGGQGRMCLPGMLLHPVKKVVETAE